jgi:2',3'-cyclic-nucleotide 2'-phosphodiesterase (5'-nucleotidase family)
MIDLFNRMEYDAWVPGNHDLDWGAETLEAAIGASKASVLCANLASPPGTEGAWKKMKPWTIKEVGGFRLGLIGLTTPGMPNWLTPETLAGVTVSDPEAILVAAVKELQGQKVDAIIVLGHMGWHYSDDFANPVRRILEAAQDVDLYLGGHSHQDRSYWKIGKVLCSQANYYGIHCGRVDLTFDLESRKLIDKRPFTVFMDNRFDEDVEVLSAAKPELLVTEKEQARVVTTLKEAIPDKGRRPTPLTVTFCRAFQRALEKADAPVEAVFHGSFGKDRLDAGAVTVADCWRVIPYENLLVTASLRAEDLEKIWKENGKVKKSNRTFYGLERVHVDGTMRWKRSGGEVLGADDLIRVAVNAYDSQSGGGRLPALREAVYRSTAKRLCTQISSRDALIAWLTEKGENQSTG